MKLVLRNGEIKEVDTTTIFNNQYNTTDGKRIYDIEVRYIIDDVRLGEFYCSSVKQGTYDEVAQAIAEKRAQIDKCKDCFWFRNYTRIEDECYKKSVVDGNKKIIDEHTVYEISCAHKSKYGGCVNDIDETPRLFREVNDCFFCNYPQGIPYMKPLKAFMIANADKYGIVPYWNDQELSIDNTFTHKKLFGSYKFEASRWEECFELENARNHFKFYIDFANKKFILCDGIGYKVVDKLTVSTCEYDYNTKQRKFYNEPIKNYDKFATWLWQIVDDFNASN